MHQQAAAGAVICSGCLLGLEMLHCCDDGAICSSQTVLPDQEKERVLVLLSMLQCALEYIHKSMHT